MRLNYERIKSDVIVQRSLLFTHTSTSVVAEVDRNILSTLLGFIPFVAHLIFSAKRLNQLRLTLCTVFAMHVKSTISVQFGRISRVIMNLASFHIMKLERLKCLWVRIAQDLHAVRDNLLRPTVFDEELVSDNGKTKIVPCLLQTCKRNRPQLYETSYFSRLVSLIALAVPVRTNFGDTYVRSCLILFRFDIMYHASVLRCLISCEF